MSTENLVVAVTPAEVVSTSEVKTSPSPPTNEEKKSLADEKSETKESTTKKGEKKTRKKQSVESVENKVLDGAIESMDVSGIAKMVEYYANLSTTYANMSTLAKSYVEASENGTPIDVVKKSSGKKRKQKSTVKKSTTGEKRTNAKILWEKEYVATNKEKIEEIKKGDRQKFLRDTWKEVSADLKEDYKKRAKLINDEIEKQSGSGEESAGEEVKVKKPKGKKSKKNDASEDEEEEEDDQEEKPKKKKKTEEEKKAKKAKRDAKKAKRAAAADSDEE
jgi:hypothetical protein